MSVAPDDKGLAQAAIECPFCKKDDKIACLATKENPSVQMMIRYTMICCRCESQGPTAVTCEEAVQLWNDRSGRPSL